MEYPLVEDLPNGKRKIVYKSGSVEYFPRYVNGYDISLEALHPKARPKLMEFIQKLSNALEKKYFVQINSAFRTQEEQKKLRASKPSLAAYISPHCFGVAIDFSVIDKTLARSVTSAKEIMTIIERVAREVGVYWGGWFQTIPKEPWHVQIAQNWQEWYRKNG